jgi:hypothetical protein
MDNNTTSMYPTHFLRGHELIKWATKEYLAASENWPFPTQFKFGIPMDDYYCEVWANGMDWQTNYWIIEEMNLNYPVPLPLLIFEDSSIEQKFNHHDFCMLIQAAMYYRRDQVFIQANKIGFYTDMVWPYLTILDDEVRYGILQHFSFKHNSQKEVDFWMNPEFVPSTVFERKKHEDNRSNRDETPGLGGGVQEGGAEIIRLI